MMSEVKLIELRILLIEEDKRIEGGGGVVGQSLEVLDFLQLIIFWIFASYLEFKQIQNLSADLIFLKRF